MGRVMSGSLSPNSRRIAAPCQLERPAALLGGVEEGLARQELDVA